MTMDAHRDVPQFTVGIRTAKSAHINAPVSLSDIKALNVWLVKRIFQADAPRDDVSENQLAQRWLLHISTRCT
jgi:hypothetical protein